MQIKVRYCETDQMGLVHHGSYVNYFEEARKIQKNYFHEYNTTLNGMIKNHKIDANEFLDFVHDINIDFLKKDLELGEELKKLEGKKIIFTNGSKKHAMNVTQKIGIDQ